MKLFIDKETVQMFRQIIKRNSVGRHEYKCLVMGIVQGDHGSDLLAVKLSEVVRT